MENHDQYPTDDDFCEWSKRRQEEEDMRPWKDVRPYVQQQNAIYEEDIKKLKTDLKWTDTKIGNFFLKLQR